VEAMIPFFTQQFGNASSRNHVYGWQAEEAVSIAREQVAHLIGAEPNEIVFTSGATEAVNLALKGVVESYRIKGKHIITCQTEHKAVLDTCRHLEKAGAEITYLPVDHKGMLTSEQVEEAIRPDTILVAVMLANNETGVLQPIQEIARVARKNQVLFFTDATQAVGKIPVRVSDQEIDLMAFSAHKLYGPKGTGALYVRRRQPRVKLIAQIDGGGHEKGLRSGTLNVPGIVGLGKACALCEQEMITEMTRLKELRDRLEERLLVLEESYRNGNPDSRLPHVIHMSFSHVEAEPLLMELGRTLALSSGSACSSASLEPSHVLKAMGLSKDTAHSSVRISLGRFTTAEEVDFAAERIMESVARIRKESPLWASYKQEQR
jgi:cysteine desulfurase